MLWSTKTFNLLATQSLTATRRPYWHTTKLFSSSSFSSSSSSSSSSSTFRTEINHEDAIINHPKNALQTANTITSSSSSSTPPPAQDCFWYNLGMKLRSEWSPPDMGFQVSVEWKETPIGIGLHATQDIARGQLVRVGRINHNLISFRNRRDIEEFCRRDTYDNEELYRAKLKYVAIFLLGYNPNHLVDEHGYPLDDDDAYINHPDRFFGVWIPANGLNHSPTPNVAYRSRPGGGGGGAHEHGLYLVALDDIKKGGLLLDDYRHHGKAPDWLREWGEDEGFELNFEGCNEFM